MPAGLPAPLTRFVGRRAELSETIALLLQTRLLTLTGPGGAGKTRLALRLASTVAGDFGDGVCFADFSPLSGGEFIWDRVATALGVKEPGPGQSWAEAVGRHLAERQTLVVLDNCEHVVEPAALVTAQLLAAAPALKVIATSREPLGVSGEVTWVLPPLSDEDALELFSDRARLVQPRFELRDQDAETARSICRRLDGLPLAIELAAARARALDLPYIAAGLKDHLTFLPSGPRTAPQRQSTLSASFEWSYDLLSEAEQALLRQLSVFAGGFDVEAALAVCPAASLELLAALADRSMIILERRHDQAVPRYRMLETIREFAAEHLDEANEVELIRKRHRDHYLNLVETLEAKALRPEHDYWLDRLRDEKDNLRAALAWSRDQGEAEALARMVADLSWFWTTPGQIIEFRSWLEAAAVGVGQLSPRLAARIRNIQGMLAALATRSFGEAPALANEALALARSVGDRREEAEALAVLGLVAGLVGGAEAARPYFEEFLPLMRSSGFALGTSVALAFFAVLRWFQAEPEETRRLAEEATAAAKAGIDRHNRLLTYYISGITAVIQGRLTDAAQVFDSVVAEGRQSNDSAYMGSLLGLAWVAMFRGDFAAAHAAVAESVAAAQSVWTDAISVTSVEPTAQWILGWMELAAGDAAQARDTLSRLVAVFRSSPMRRYAAVPLIALAEAQLALGAPDHAAASLNEATALAQAGRWPWVLGRVSLVRVKLLAREGKLQEAETLAHEALGLGRDAGDQMGLVDALELLARLAAGQGSTKEAIRLWAAAEAQRMRLGYRFSVDRASNEAAIAQANEALGPDEFSSAWTEGAKLSGEEVLAYAARGRGERKRPTAGWASLTPSELEVVRLVGQHLSNPQIAAKLFVSRATVKTHLVHIFAKLGMDSRSELAAEAIKHGWN